MRNIRKDVTILSKVCTVAHDGPWAVYEKKPQWKYHRLTHESYEWKLRDKYRKLTGGTDMMVFSEDVSETVYVAHAFVKVGSKKEALFREEGFM